MDPYHFDPDPEGEKAVPDNTQDPDPHKIKKNSNFFSSIKNMILNSQHYDFFCCYWSLFIHINQISDLFLYILYFRSSFGIIPDPFSYFTIRIRPDPDPQHWKIVFSVAIMKAQTNVLKLFVATLVFFSRL